LSVYSFQFSVLNKLITVHCLLKTVTLLTLSAVLAVACGSNEPPPTPIPTATPETIVIPTPAGPSASQIELVVDSLGTDRERVQSVVILKAKDSGRYLLIWIGPFEANAIAAEVYGVTVTRPQTHDLMGNVIDTLGARIDHVVVSDLRSGTFYATMILRRNGSVMSVDSRPSDAIALAVRSQAPIYAESWIVEMAGVDQDPSTGGPALPGEAPSSQQPFD
jgi:hypothetical protein